MEEHKVALIPNVVVQGAMGPKQYAVLLTDKRSIFVLESSSSALLGGVLGGAVGAVIAQAAATQRSFDYEHADPEALAAEEKSIAIPHANLRKLVLRKKLGGYQLLVEHEREVGKRKKLTVIVVPPPEQLKQRKREGVNRKVALRDYATRIQEAYMRALPPAAAAMAEWRV